MKEALKLALEELENLINQHYAETTTNDDLEKADNAITAIKEALAQPEKEPDVYIPADALRQLKGTSLLILRSVPLYGYRGDGLTPLYTTPPQPKEQEPVAHVCVFPLRGGEFFPQTRIEWKNGRPVAGPLYTTPPQRKPLTDEEVRRLYKVSTGFDFHGGSALTAFIRAIEAAHGIKGD